LKPAGPIRSAHFNHLKGKIMTSIKMLSILMAAALVSAAAAEGKNHVHGYAEVHSNNTLKGSRMVDPHRTVIGLKSELAPWITFSMEVDFEHAFNEPELEFAHVDFAVNEWLTLRAGDMLMPVGPLNEFHEPPLFYSVERPYVQNRVIPTTWQEVGAGALLSLMDNTLKVRAYAVNGLVGLKALDTATFTVDKGIRGMRSKTVNAPARDWAGVGRVEYSPLIGLTLGASAYYGGADHSPADSMQIAVGLYNGDLRCRWKGLDLQFVYAYGTMGGTYFSSFRKKDDVAFTGFTTEAGYQIPLPKGKEATLTPFVRYEGLSPDTKNDASTADEQVVTAGLTWHPVPAVAVKADAEFWSAESDTKYTENDGTKTGKKTVINVGIGVMY
jgi:hypothetical protein